MEFQDNDKQSRPTWEEIQLPEVQEHERYVPEVDEGPLPHGITPGHLERIIQEDRRPNPDDYKWIIPFKD